MRFTPQITPRLLVMFLILCFLAGCSKKEKESTQSKVDSETKTSSTSKSNSTQNESSAISKRSPLSFIPEDALVAWVLHPRRMTQTEVGKEILSLPPVKAELTKTEIQPQDVEQVILAFSPPSERGQNHCFITTYAKPLDRELILREEFAGLPYEKVQFQDVSYYQFANQFAGENEFAPNNPVVGNIAPNGNLNPNGNPALVENEKVIAKYPHDRKPNENGHADSTESGNWLYYSSKTLNPSVPGAGLAELTWNEKESRYEGNQVAVNRKWPAIGLNLHPGFKSPEYVCLPMEISLP